MKNEISYSDLKHMAMEAARREANKHFTFARIGKVSPREVTTEEIEHFAEVGAAAAVELVSKMVRLSIQAQRPMNPNDKKRTLNLITP